MKSLCWSALVLAFFVIPWAGAVPLRVEKTAEAVTIHSEKAPVLRYVLKQPPDAGLPVESACYFHPLTSPGGVGLTEVAPGDHKHHRGVFLAWVEMHGGGVDADFWGWGESAPIARRKIVNRDVVALVAESTAGGFTARNEWRTDDTVMLHEELRSEVSERDGIHVLDLTYTFNAPAELTLSRWAFSGFCVRTRKEGVVAWDPSGKVSLPAPQHTKPESNWPDRPWYAFTLKGADNRAAGVAVMSHPANSPTLWHNAVGLGMLNPCVVAPAALKVTPGKPLVLRYRVVTFDGDLPTEKLDKHAREWAARK